MGSEMCIRDRADPDTKDEIIFEIFSNESLPNCDNENESINIFD